MCIAYRVQPRRAYDLGDLIFKAQACEIWGLAPDLFAEPEARVAWVGLDGVQLFTQ